MPLFYLMSRSSILYCLINSDLSDKQDKTWVLISDLTFGSGGWTSVALNISNVSDYNEIMFRGNGQVVTVPMSVFLSTTVNDTVIIGRIGTGDTNVSMVAYKDNISVWAYFGTTIGLTSNHLRVYVR